MDEETDNLTNENPQEQAEFTTLQEQIDVLTIRAEIAEIACERAKAQSTELDRLNARLQADFDNHKKRTQENAVRLKEDGVAYAAERILPLADTLERAVSLTHDKQTADGLKMVLRQFYEVLTDLNVEEIPALGEPFDPGRHNAVAGEQVKDPALINTVTEVFQKGYRLGERVIRYAAVKVGK